MQTIARANRVFPGKHSGLIVDYANVFASLEKALAIYGKGGSGTMPVRDKKALADELRYAVNDANVFCLEHGVALVEIENMPTANFAQAGAIQIAADRLMAPETIKRDFLALEALVSSLYRAVKPDPVAIEFARRCGCLAAIVSCIRTVSEPPDISHIMKGIQDLLDESIAAEPFKIQQTTATYGQIDLSKINFEALRKRFESKKPSNTDVERLKAAVRAQLERMVRLNPTRADYLQKFQELIEGYNSGSRNIEEIFKELLGLSIILTEEQTRHVRENLSEEELTILDILTRPAPELTTEEREEVKKVAHQLLEKLHKLLVLGWRQKISTRARVKIEIENALDEGLPRAYSKDIYEAKCSAIFEHVYQSYQGDGRSVYAA
jgi:type I restriction enzyme R subunit